MTAKSFILAAQLFARSIFWWPREGQGVLPEKSNTGPKMDARKLAVDHWRYIEGVLLRHGVPADVNRTTPVNHRMLLNAQHLIDISRRRLCYQASHKPRFAWRMVRDAVMAIDHDLARYMVPNCVYRGGYCCEPRPCGQYNAKRYNPDVIFEQICKGAR